MKRFLSLALASLTAVALTLGVGIRLKNADGAISAHVQAPVLSADSASVIPGADAPDVTVIKDGRSDYVIVGKKAETYALAEFLYSECARVNIADDTDARAETKNEIIIGESTRQLAKDLKAALSSVAGDTDVYAWGIACRDGQIALCHSGGAHAEEQMYEMLASLITDENLVLKEGLMLLDFKTFAEYEKEKQEEADRLEEEKYQKRLSAALALYNTHKGSEAFKTQLVFKNGQLVEKILHEDGAELMPTDTYEYPPYTPAYGDHPRILVTKDKVPEILKLLEDPRFSSVASYFWQYANAEGVTGIIPATGTVTHKNGTPDDASDDYAYENHNSTTIMFQIEAKALAYVLTGDVVYAYEAIAGIKNAILTERYWTASQQDTYHGYAMVMEIAAYVYDWCYDVMTEEDKNQIVDGIRFYLCPYIEFNYPPSNMGYVSGHGTGSQMFRVWISLAASMADERPDWWAFVGGRFYQQYIPVVNQMYASGFVPQGTNYGPGKYSGQLLSAYMLETMGDTDAMTDGIGRRAPYYLLSMIMPNGNMFQTGDATNGMGHLPSGQTYVEWNWMLAAAALTDDPVILSYAYKYSVAQGKYDFSMTEHITPTLFAILAASCSTWEQLGEVDFSLGLIQYNGFPGGQTTVRNSWSEDAVALFMKVTDRTMANHDHRDSGSFQIYYKGLLACDSGYYTGVSYGSNHSRYYQQATVAHNGLLVYDPLKATDKFYSGGQIRVNEASTLEQWNGGKYDFAKIIGRAEGYSQNGALAKYAYIAGDMTNSYDSASVNYIARHMLTVMQNGNDDIPMVMFIYDDIESDNTAAIKKFLLHTVNEPSIDTDTNIVTAIEKEGKITLVPLFGVEKVEKIGGEGKEYWVGKDAENGYNVTDGIEDRNPEGSPYGSSFMWGRVELSATGESTNRMLNMIYVSDKNSQATVNATVIETEAILGAQIDGSVVLFSKERTKQKTAFTVTTTGDGLQSYYVAGLKSGVWTVVQNGEALGTVYASEASAFVSFKALPGEITLEPRAVENRFPINYELYDAVLPNGYAKKYTEGKGLEMLPIPTHPAGFSFLGWYENAEFTGEEVTSIGADRSGAISLCAKWDGSRIDYVLNGGELPAGAAQYYKHSVGLAKLPVPTHKANYEFLGWYSDSAFKNAQTSIGTDAMGEVTLYAKWKKPPAVYADYDGTGLDGNLSGALSKATLDGDGVFKWTTAKEGPIITIAPNGENYSVMYGDELAVSFTVSVAKAPDSDIIESYLRIITSKDTGSKEVRIFTINGDGVVTLGKTSTQLFTVTEELQTMRIVLNFATGKLTAYNELGFAIAETDAPLPSGISDFETYRQLFNNSTNLINWRANCAGALYIGDIVIEEGNTHISEEAKISNMVTYQTNGGEIEGEPERYFRPGVGIDELPTPTHPNGFNFLGWYESEDFSGEAVTSIAGDLGRNITLYASWNGSSIKYNLAEGTLNGEYALFYIHGIGLSELPTPVHPNGYAFLGWYSNADFAIPVTEIGAMQTGDVTLYAKWQRPPIVYFENDGSTNSGITANFKPDFEGRFAPTDTDQDEANDAIEWSIGKGEHSTRPNLSIFAANAYNVMHGSEHAVSFTVDLAAIAGYGNIVTTFRFGGSAIGGTIEIFKTYADGTVKLKNGSKVICTLAEDMQTLRIVFDFDNAKIFAYDENGELIDSVDTKAPSGYASLEEWRQSYVNTVSILNWYLSGHDGTDSERYGMYIGGLKIEESNVFDK